MTPSIHTPSHPVRHRRAVAAAAAAFVITAVAGCTTTPGEANLSALNDGRVQFPAINHRFAVRVVAIDDQSNNFRRPLIEPGRHEVRFTAPPVALLTQSVEKTYTLDIQPCTRYYPAAQRDSAFESDWHLVIERVEPIGGACSAPGGATRFDASADGVATPQPIVVDAGRLYP